MEVGVFGCCEGGGVRGVYVAGQRLAIHPHSLHLLHLSQDSCVTRATWPMSTVRLTHLDFMAASFRMGRIRSMGSPLLHALHPP